MIPKRDAWRDLRKTEVCLKSRTCNLAISVGLTKTFSKKEAYWIDAYHSPKEGNLRNEWFISRQWSFVRDNKLIENNTTKTGLYSPSSAASTFNTFLQQKLQNGWKINSVIYGDHSWINSEVELVNQIKLNLDTLQQSDSSPFSVKFTTKTERLKALQNKRKVKAEW